MGGGDIYSTLAQQKRQDVSNLGTSTGCFWPTAAGHEGWNRPKVGEANQASKIGLHI